MADKKGIFRSPGNIIFNAQSISERADQLRVADDSIIVNYDRTGATATLQLSQTTANATITWDGTALTTSAPITGVLNVVDAGGDGSVAYSGNTLTYTGPSATEVRAHFSAGTGLTYSSGEYSITNTAVTAGDYGSATAIPTYTVNAQGQLTAAADVNIAIPASQITDFSEAVDDRVGAMASGGTGITAVYDDAANTLVFNLDNTAVTPNTYGSATGVGTFTVDQQGRITSALTTAIAIPHTQVTDFDTEVRALFAGTSGQITYTSGSGTFSLPATITQATDFSTGLTAPTVAGNDDSTNVATTEWVTDNAPGTLVSVTGGTGITTSPNPITSSGTVSITNTAVNAGSYGSATAIPTYTVNAQGQLTNATDVSIAIPSSQITDFNSAVGTRIDAELTGGDGIDYTAGDIAVDTTVVRTTGNQTIGGTKTFTGTVDLTGTASTTATTQSASDNSTKVATTAYVETAIANLQGGAPATLDTLNEIATALGNDAALNTTLTNSIATKAPLTRNLTAGNGLTGGGDLNSDRTFNIVGAGGGGITVNADSIQVDSSVLRRTGAAQTVESQLTFDSSVGPVINSGGTLTIGSSIYKENDIEFDTGGDIFFDTGINFKTAIRAGSGILRVEAEEIVFIDIAKGNTLSNSGFVVRDQLNDANASTNATLLTTTENGGIGVNHLLLKDITKSSSFGWRISQITIFFPL